MIFWVYTIVLVISSFVLAAICTWGMRELMKAMLPARTPNERDNHKEPTPRGGGVAVMVAIIGFLTVVNLDGYVLLALIALLAVSFADDLTNISGSMRIVVHIICALLLVSTIDHGVFITYLNMMPFSDMAIPYMPYVSVVFTASALVWFMNLYNFMDGVDEITVVQTVSLAAGISMIAFMQPDISQNIGAEALIIIAAITGFWLFNRHPATVFLGDCGSIPLGALLGWMLLFLASRGYDIVALILPAYYIVDATLILLWRILTRQAFWKAHSQHAYQAVVKGGRTHRAATVPVALLNTGLIMLSYIALTQPQYAISALILAYASSLLLCAIFRSIPAKKEVVEEDASHALGSIELNAKEYQDITPDNALS